MDRKKHKPTLKELPDLFDHFGGNLTAIARHTGYSVRQVNNWITEAVEPLHSVLTERLEQSRINTARSRFLRQEHSAFIIPLELKHLISLFYKTPWPELQFLDIKEIIASADIDPDAPHNLQYKIEWSDLRKELQGDDDYLGLEQMAVTVNGVIYQGWHQHLLLSWVGLNEASPLWNDHDVLPDVLADDHEGRPHIIASAIEPTVRLLIKRLEVYL